MTHPCLKSCLKIHTSHNSLVNYASCVYSIFFVDLAQLITVLAIAPFTRPASPSNHHKTHSPPTHFCLKAHLPYSVGLCCASQTIALLHAAAATSERAQCHQSARSLCALMRNRRGVGVLISDFESMLSSDEAN